MKKEILYYTLISIILVVAYFLLFKFSNLDITILFSLNIIKLSFVKFIIILIPLAICAYLISKKINIEKINEKKLMIVIFLFSFLITTFFWNSPQIDPDSARYLTHAKDLNVNVGNRGTDMPLIPIIYKILYTIFGESLIIIEAFNSLLYSSIVFLTFLIAKKLFNKVVGTYAALIFTSMHGVIAWIGLALVDIPACFFVTLSLYISIIAFEKKKVHWFLLLTILAILSVLTKMHTAMFFVPPLLIMTLFRIKNKKLLIAIILLITIVIMIILFNLQKIIDIGRYALYAGSFNAAASGKGLLAIIFQIGPVFLLILPGIFFIKKKECLILYSWILIPALPIFLVAYHDTMFRYYIPATPAIAIISGFMIFKIFKNKKNLAKYTVLLILFSGLIISLFGFVPLIKNAGDSNLLKAAQYLNKLDNVKTVAVYTSSFTAEETEANPIFLGQKYNPEPLVVIFDLYCYKDIVYGGNLGDESNFIRDWTYNYELPKMYINSTKLSQAEAAVVIPDYYKTMSNIPNMSLSKSFDGGTRTVLPWYAYVYLRNDLISV
ncbi:MAG: glycosyltransferase family 39 protein [Candidatus Pacearchaeota archaeon]